MPLLQLDDHVLSYRRRGRGRPAIMLLHGAGACSRDFVPLLHLLGQRRLTVAIDLPAHARSSAPRPLPPPEALLGCYREAVATLGERLGMGRFVVVGHSMGGAVAQLFALAYPERVAALVLIGTGAALPIGPETRRVLQRDFDRLPALFAATGYSPATDAGQAAAWAAARLRASRRVTIADFDACQLFDVRGRLDRLECPTTVIAGRDDVITPTPLLERLAEQIPRARLHEVSRAGHQVHQERPDEVARLVLETPLE